MNSIPANEVRERLGHHILADGMRMVLDLGASQGSFLQDAATGKRYLDFFSSFSTTPLGLNHPGLLDPVFVDTLMATAINKISNSDLYTPELAAFVETFITTLPEEFRSHLFFIEGGALAVENALKTAFDWKRRKNLAAGRTAKGAQIIHFEEAFHGRSGYTMSLTNTDPIKTAYFPKFEWPRIINPKLSFPITESVLAEVALVEQQAEAQILQALADNPDDIAGLIIEPIQGEGGDSHFRPEFLQRLRQLADEHEFLLIFDEVQTGFATTGKWWAFEHFDVQPDVFAFGKKTQVCGIAAGPRVDEVDSVFSVPSRINSTWGGNLVDMTRCKRIIEIIVAENLIENAARVGDRLRQGLEHLSTTVPEVTSPRGRGMFLAFDLPDNATRKNALKALYDHGVLGLASGDRAIRFRPPLSLSEEEADLGLERCASALQSVL